MMVRSSARVDLGIQHVGIVLCIRWRSGPSVGRDRTGPECRRKVVPVLADRHRLDGALHERRGIGVMKCELFLVAGSEQAARYAETTHGIPHAQERDRAIQMTL